MEGLVRHHQPKQITLAQTRSSGRRLERRYETFRRTKPEQLGRSQVVRSLSGSFTKSRASNPQISSPTLKEDVRTVHLDFRRTRGHQEFLDLLWNNDFKLVDFRLTRRNDEETLVRLKDRNSTAYPEVASQNIPQQKGSARVMGP